MTTHPRSRAAQDTPPSSADREEGRPVWSVYVAGFLDWPQDPSEAEGFNEWQCRRNPSGYLFIGRWYDGRTKPDPTQGPLPRALRSVTQTRDGRPIEWTFDLLPVRWGVARSILARSYDVVVNLGVGVYSDRFGSGYETILLVEDGARNRRSSAPDAAGKSIQDEGALAGTIDPTDARGTRPSPPHVRRKILDCARDMRVGDTTFTVLADPARDANAFVCNETHYMMLAEADLSRRPRQAYFIHIPKPSNIRRGGPLASVLKKLIEDLIQPST